MGDFLESAPADVWAAIVDYCDTSDDDLRAALGCVLLEELLHHHFDVYFPRVKKEIQVT